MPTNRGWQPPVPLSSDLPLGASSPETNNNNNHGDHRAGNDSPLSVDSGGANNRSSEGNPEVLVQEPSVAPTMHAAPFVFPTEESNSFGRTSGENKPVVGIAGVTQSNSQFSGSSNDGGQIKTSPASPGDLGHTKRPSAGVRFDEPVKANNNTSGNNLASFDKISTSARNSVNSSPVDGATADSTKSKPQTTSDSGGDPKPMTRFSVSAHESPAMKSLNAENGTPPPYSRQQKRPSVSAIGGQADIQEASMSTGRHVRRRSSAGFESSASAMEIAMYWHDVLMRYGGMDVNTAALFAEEFGKMQMPMPSSDAEVYLTHEFLKEIGVEEAADRARIILACKRMPAVRNMATGADEKKNIAEKLEGGNSNNGIMTPLLSTYEEDTREVRLRMYQSQEHEYVWYDLKGSDLNQKTGESPIFDGKLRELINRLTEEENNLSMMSHQFGGGDDDGGGTYDLVTGILDTKLPLPHLRVDPYSPACCAFVLRVCTLEDVNEDDDTVRELTNRWTVFVDSANMIVATLHRVDSPALAAMRDNWKANASLPFSLFITKILERFLAEYHKALSNNSEWLDRCEAKMLASTQSDSMLGSLFHLQRRCSVYDRMIELTKNLVERDVARQLKITEEVSSLKPQFGALQERCTDLQSRAQNLLEIHLSLINYNTNELMKVLTKFSMFFTPITFIAAVYGMNFSNMPELEYENSYFIVLGVMALSVIVIFAWFRLRQL